MPESYKQVSYLRVLKGPGFTGSGFLLFEPRNLVFKSKIEARFGIESMRGRWDAKKTLGITGLHEILSRDYGTEGPS